MKGSAGIRRPDSKGPQDRGVTFKESCQASRSSCRSMDSDPSGCRGGNTGDAPSSRTGCLPEEAETSTCRRRVEPPCSGPAGSGCLEGPTIRGSGRGACNSANGGAAGTRRLEEASEVRSRGCGGVSDDDLGGRSGVRGGDFARDHGAADVCVACLLGARRGCLEVYRWIGDQVSGYGGGNDEGRDEQSVHDISLG